MVINSPCLTDKKELAIPGQTATGKEFSNPLMAGSLPKTISAKALVDKKKVIIIKTSIRSDLHLQDADGTDCLPTARIFEELARIGAKSTSWNEFSSTMASIIICLATNKKINLSKYIFDAMKKQSRRKQKKNTEVPHPSDSTANVPNEEHVPTPSNDPLNHSEALKVGIGLSLGLEVKQKPDGIFISQDKYVQDILKKFDMESVRPATTPFEASKPKYKDEPDNAVNVHLYRSMI
ncbi:hypothetical protein Tco_0759609, partial [Tanacetum coccineum]